MEPFEFEPSSSLPTFLDHETLKILEDEFVPPFGPFPYPFSLPNKMVSCANVGVGKYKNKIYDPLIPPSSPFHDQDFIQ